MFILLNFSHHVQRNINETDKIILTLFEAKKKVKIYFIICAQHDCMISQKGVSGQWPDY